MKIIPAIDLMGGRCVQLVGGQAKTKKDFGDPVERAIEWVRMGFEILHVIDLDATLELGDNTKSVTDIREAVDVPIEFGGGIRTVGKAKEMLVNLGEKDRIIVGTLAVADYPGFSSLKKLSKYKNQIIVSVDSKDGYVAVKGWQEKSRLKASELMKSCEDRVWGFLYTNVDVEGQMKGINAKTVEEVVSATKKPVIVSGGITTKDDIFACKKTGAWGAVLGKALYEKKIKIEEIL
ncbi:MAG: 1-(5-phosphoribosyl)-5-[(5-phosphoribosylamino)methylideneamino] imidazole-4-carboxamide isomerase [Candidatus Altiarchaeota archaeon]|nr:1-(5-phosphoribosyl)-5-[(5-phosphoribosylamino)methylideneamino] imidazole-4-carboxamide isomerase [Candidatus Altiarchaeota archaeon]